jgi:prepilin-type N-terminal cleavage/methylation domain-containing protein
MAVQIPVNLRPQGAEQPLVNPATQNRNRGRNSPGRCPKDGGFTLIELMVVLVVVGLVLMATMPSFSRYIASSRLAGAASTLVTDLHYARALANSQHTTYELRRTTAGYSLVRVAPTTTVLTRTMPRGVTLTAAGTTTFYSWGLTQPASITLQQGGHSSVVQLSASGRVSRD